MTADPGSPQNPAGLVPSLYQGFDQVLGLRYDSLTPDGATARLTVAAHLLQPYGILHGGVLCSVVESVGSAAAAAWFGERGQVVGVANTTNFVRACREGVVLTATATPVHRGRTSQLWDIDIVDESARLVARGSLRVANISTADGLGRS